MNLDELRKLREKGQREMMQRADNAKYRIIVGMGTSGIAAGARDVLKAFIDEINSRGVGDVVVMQAGKKEYSSKEPVVEIFEDDKDPVQYGNISVEKVKRIINEHIIKGVIVKEYLITSGI